MISNSNGKFVIVLHETILIEFLLALIFQFLTVSPMDWPLPRTALFGPIGTGSFEITEHSKKCQTLKKVLVIFSSISCEQVNPAHRSPASRQEDRSSKNPCEVWTGSYR